MICYIQGILTFASPSVAVIEAAGVGYKIHITAMTFGRLPQTGKDCRLYTVHVVREQSQTLYGFLNDQSCEMFETLLGVTGIGPKLALTILGHMTENDLAQAVHSEDIPRLSKIPGIGKKTAQRLLIEMKDKIIEPDCLSLAAPPQLNPSGKLAVNALVNLGYTPAVAQKAVKKTLEYFAEEPELAVIIAESLKNI